MRAVDGLEKALMRRTAAHITRYFRRHDARYAD